jgi:hypothetical protein
MTGRLAGTAGSACAEAWHRSAAAPNVEGHPADNEKRCQIPEADWLLIQLNFW